MKKQKEWIRVTLKLEGIGLQGAATAQYDGRQVYVDYGIPGEEVVAEIAAAKGGRYYVGRVIQVLSPSAARVEPPCPYYGSCTGCQWQHISYEQQLLLKEDMVRSQLKTFGGLEDPLVKPTLACDPWSYRNHARFTIGPNGQLGFVNRYSRRFVRIDRCLLMHPWINEALSKLQDKCQETTQLSIRYGVNSGSWLIQPRLQSADIPLSSGQPHYEEELLGHGFRISASSFFQVNTAMAERMTTLMKERLGLTGTELLVDAYAGVGTFALLLAPYAERVIAIEESASALKDASANLSGAGNVEIVQGKTEDALPGLAQRPDAVILDPPRKGCHPAALDALIAIRPSRIAYVSCEPSALGRDLRRLTDGGYRLVEVQPIDLFPQTNQIECVATLSLE